MSALLELTNVTAPVPTPLAASPVAAYLAIDSEVMEPRVKVSTLNSCTNKLIQK